MKRLPRHSNLTPTCLGVTPTKRLSVKRSNAPRDPPARAHRHEGIRAAAPGGGLPRSKTLMQESWIKRITKKEVKRGLH
eukprot:6805779-Prymnesium_polylepis.1